MKTPASISKRLVGHTNAPSGFTKSIDLAPESHQNRIPHDAIERDDYKKHGGGKLLLISRVLQHTGAILPRTAAKADRKLAGQRRFLSSEQQVLRPVLADDATRLHRRETTKKGAALAGGFLALAGVGYEVLNVHNDIRPDAVSIRAEAFLTEHGDTISGFFGQKESEDKAAGTELVLGNGAEAKTIKIGKVVCTGPPVAVETDAEKPNYRDYLEAAEDETGEPFGQIKSAKVARTIYDQFSAAYGEAADGSWVTATACENLETVTK